MSVSTTSRRSGGLVDPTLAKRAKGTKAYLIGALTVALIATAAVVAQAVLLARVLDLVLHQHGTFVSVRARLIGVILAVVIRSICLSINDSLAQRTGAHISAQLRRSLLEKAIERGPAWAKRERSGELSAVATSGINSLSLYYGRYLPQAVIAVVVPPVLLIWIVINSWQCGLVALGGLILIPPAMIYFGKKAAATSERQWRQLSSLSARFVEMVRGISTLRVFGREQNAIDEVVAATTSLRQTTARVLRTSFLSGLALEFIGGVTTGLVAMVLGFGLLGSWITYPTAFAILLIAPEIFIPLRRASAEFHASKEGQAAAARIFAILDEDEGQQTLPTPTRHLLSKESLPTLFVENLAIRYLDRDLPAIENLSFVIAPGQHLAITGPSGSGKSSLVAAILGFVSPESGSLSLGQHSQKEVDPREWRQHFAWVPQHAALLSTTLRENLLVGTAHASDDRLFEALERVGLLEKVQRFREGLDTSIGERGQRFSAGERQRIALARAWLKTAPIVVLDEPVAHLDRESERQLQRDLDDWLSTKSVLVVAHRPELLSRIDATLTLTLSLTKGRKM